MNNKYESTDDQDLDRYMTRWTWRILVGAGFLLVVGFVMGWI